MDYRIIGWLADIAIRYAKRPQLIEGDPLAHAYQFSFYDVYGSCNCTRTVVKAPLNGQKVLWPERTEEHETYNQD